jgi:hypothetical protein
MAEKVILSFYNIEFKEVTISIKFEIFRFHLRIFLRFYEAFNFCSSISSHPIFILTSSLFVLVLTALGSRVRSAVFKENVDGEVSEAPQVFSNLKCCTCQN